MDRVYVARFYAHPTGANMRVSDDLALLKRALKKEFKDLSFRAFVSSSCYICIKGVEVGMIETAPYID